MANIYDVANFFIDLADKQKNEDPMTHLRLQKLLYFAQAWSLVRFGKPLFEQTFEAWQYGPVVPELYRKYQHYGRNPLPCETFDNECFTEEEYDLLLDVARYYMKYSTGMLVAMSHRQGAPWANAGQSGIIDNAKIAEYFKNEPPLESFDSILDQYPVEAL